MYTIKIPMERSTRPTSYQLHPTATEIGWVWLDVCNMRTTKPERPWPTWIYDNIRIHLCTVAGRLNSHLRIQIYNHLGADRIWDMFNPDLFKIKNEWNTKKIRLIEGFLRTKEMEYWSQKLGTKTTNRHHSNYCPGGSKNTIPYSTHLFAQSMHQSWNDMLGFYIGKPIVEQKHHLWGGPLCRLFRLNTKKGMKSIRLGNLTIFSLERRYLLSYTRTVQDSRVFHFHVSFIVVLPFALIKENPSQTHIKSVRLQMLPSCITKFLYVFICLYPVCIQIVNSSLVGGLNPSEKYENQLGWLFPIYGKIKDGNQTTNQQWYEKIITLPTHPTNLGVPIL